MAWFPKEVDKFWIHISFVYANIYLSFYFEGPHSNFRYILVALKKDGNNVHFFDVLPHCGGGIFFSSVDQRATSIKVLSQSAEKSGEMHRQTNFYCFDI